MSVLGQTILDNAQTLEDFRRTVLSLFLEISSKDGVVPIVFLQKHTTGLSQKLLKNAIEELLDEELIVKQYNSDYERGIKLTAKGALRLWFWDWT